MHCNFTFLSQSQGETIPAQGSNCIARMDWVKVIHGPEPQDATESGPLTWTALTPHSGFWWRDLIQKCPVIAMIDH